jgi:hypothetical protein
MLRALAVLLNMLGSKSIERGKPNLAKCMYQFAAHVDSRWSVPWYNLGLQAKYESRWAESQHFNQRAVEFDPADEAAWWNLGIASTALKNWSEARRAWTACGIDLDDRADEVRMPPVTACVRLNPKGDGEVVWGERLDPARIAILNVPLPQSGHRFNDVVLNDGASNGTRVDDNGREVPVFDELTIWSVSNYSTFRARLNVPDDAARKSLVDLCETHELGVEDWSTIRFICSQCSRGNPGPHKCEARPLEDGSRRFGFAAKNLDEMLAVLQEWSSANGSADLDEPELLLPAKRS